LKTECTHPAGRIGHERIKKSPCYVSTTDYPVFVVQYGQKDVGWQQYPKLDCTMNLMLFLIGLGAVVLFLSIVIVQQGTVAVITIFGKYTRVMGPGLNFKIPFIEMIYRRISIQNRSVELAFQAITADQANVNFKAMLVYSVLNQDEETIKNVAFKFIDEASFMQALIRTIEGSIRSFVATKRHQNIGRSRKNGRPTPGPGCRPVPRGGCQRDGRVG
jgi:hypothetical protein